MKYNKEFCGFTTILLTIFLAVSSLTVNASQAAPNSINPGKLKTPALDIPVVDYNKKSDQLTVNISDVSLRQVLVAISRKSGIQILMDPAIKLKVSARFKNQKLLKGLQQLLRNTNAAYFFNEQKNKNGPMLLAVKIIPKGRIKSDNLQPIVGLPSEATQHARSRRDNKGKNSDYTSRRWQSRMDRMPEGMRKRLEKETAKKLAKEAKRKEKGDKRAAKRKAKKEERRLARITRQAKIEKELKQNHPGLYEERLQIRQAGRERAKRETDERGILTFGR